MNNGEPSQGAYETVVEVTKPSEMGLVDKLASRTNQAVLTSMGPQWSLKKPPQKSLREKCVFLKHMCENFSESGKNHEILLFYISSKSLCDLYLFVVIFQLQLS